jgi:hypothetical protein
MLHSLQSWPLTYCRRACRLASPPPHCCLVQPRARVCFCVGGIAACARGMRAAMWSCVLLWGRRRCVRRGMRAAIWLRGQAAGVQLSVRQDTPSAPALKGTFSHRCCRCAGWLWLASPLVEVWCSCAALSSLRHGVQWVCRCWFEVDVLRWRMPAAAVISALHYHPHNHRIPRVKLTMRTGWPAVKRCSHLCPL